MPVPAPEAPRQMLPPPTTMATSTFSSWRTSAISVARRNTTSPSMAVSPLPANASPDSLRTTRRHRGITGSANLDLGEAHDGGVAERLADGLLLVVDPRLLVEHPAGHPLEPAGEL